jgi:hypothetical protein
VIVAGAGAVSAGGVGVFRGSLCYSSPEVNITILLKRAMSRPSSLPPVVFSTWVTAAALTESLEKVHHA